MKTSDQLSSQLLSYLLEHKKISPDKFLILQKKTNPAEIETALLAEYKISEDDIFKAKSSIYKLPYISFGDQRISSDILNIFPRELAENYQMAAFDKIGKTIHVGLVDPANLKALEAAEFIARSKELKIKYHLISSKSFRRIIQQYGSLKVEVGEALEMARDKFHEEGEGENFADETMEKVIRSAPISKMVAVILKHAVESRASDVHIEPANEETRVRYRVDGRLHISLILPKYVHAAIVSRIKVMANLRIDETRMPQDGRIRLNIGGANIDFRVSTLPLYSQEKVVMRILDTSSGVSTWEDLGFAGRSLDIMRANIGKPHGMFLVTGPTGSGKSTTLYAALQILNQEDVNIVTLEDPVEYYLKGVNQSQVRPEVKFTFASGLRSILRQDPDIIMVGEIRDAETAELAIHASLTGHIVLSTLHTNDAFGAIPRLIDMGIEPFLIASTLNIVIAQRLVRTICLKCKQKIELPATLRPQVEEIFHSIPPKNLPAGITAESLANVYRGKGCPHCNQTGYKGRTAIVEVFAITDEIKDIINAGFKISAVQDLFIKQGMLNLKQDGLVKILAGITTPEEVLTVTKD